METHCLRIYLNPPDRLQLAGLKQMGAEGIRANGPGRFPEMGLLEVSEAFSSGVMRPPLPTTAIMDVFNNGHHPSGNMVQNSSTFPLSEWNTIKYLRLEVPLTLGHCLREGGRNPSLNLGSLERLLFLLDTEVESRWINGEVDQTPRTWELVLATKPRYFQAAGPTGKGELVCEMSLVVGLPWVRGLYWGSDPVEAPG